MNISWRDSWMGRLEWPAVLALLAVHIALAWWFRAPGLTTGNDDALYLMLADQLAQGRYHDWFLPGAPPHGRYPPGFPAFLAVLQGVAGSGLDRLLAANIACSAAALAVFHRLTRRKLSPGIALAALAIGALNPKLISEAGALASEPLFMLSIAVSLILLDRPTRSAAGSAYAALAVGFATLVRSAGIPLVAAQVMYWLGRRDMKRALVAGAVGGVPVVAWLLWARYAAQQALSMTYWSGENATGRSPVSRGLFAVIERLWHNASDYVAREIPLVLPLPTLPGTIIENVVWLALLVITLTIGSYVFWKRWPAALWYLLAYGALLAAWTWPLSRFLLPVLPLLVAMILTGILTPEWIDRRLRVVVAFGLVAIIATTAVMQLTQRAVAIAPCERQPFPRVSSCYLDRQRGYFAALQEAARASRADEVLLASKNATAAYVTHRMTLPANHFARLRGDALRRELLDREVRFIISAHLLPYDTQLAEGLLEICGSLTMAGRYAGDTLLLEVVSQADATRSRSACAALAERQPESTAMSQPVPW